MRKVCQEERKVFEEKEILEILESANGLVASEFSHEINDAIVAAAKCSKTTRNKAALLVHNALDGWENWYITTKYGVMPGSNNYEDYKSEMFVTILEHLGRWNPDRAGLVTYFSYWFEKACIRERCKSTTMSSVYYEEINNAISRAEAILFQRGIKNPTVKELKETMLNDLNLDRAESSIRKTLLQRVDFVSIDGWQHGSDDFEDIAEKDTQPTYSDKTLAVIDAMSDVNRLVMLCLCKFHEESARKHMPTKKLKEELKKYVGDVDDAWVESRREIARREFIHKYRTIAV